MNEIKDNELFEALLRDTRSDLSKLGIHEAGKKLDNEISTSELRRSGLRRRADEPFSTFSLREHDGILSWEAGIGSPPVLSGRRQRKRANQRSGRTTAHHGRIIKQLKFEDIPANQIDQMLTDLDHKLTPNQGLHSVSFNNGRCTVRTDDAAPATRPEKKILLFIHGTFSSCERFAGSFAETRAGREFLAQSKSKYHQVLAFNHPTLSVPPILNAIQLAQCFRNSSAQVDIVCHSRGGLVARWWMELTDSEPQRKKRCVFIGSPLSGTGLAAPHRLKATIDYYTNIARALNYGAQGASALLPAAAPLFLGAAGLLKIFSVMGSVASKTPLVDAGVSLVPGLAGQSRQGLNQHIRTAQAQFESMKSPDRMALLRNYYFVTANFEPESDPWWKFWKHFRTKKLLDNVADKLFDGPNDMVVDTVSMTDLVSSDTQLSNSMLDVIKKNTKAFSKSSKLHHLNYTSDSRVIRFIDEKLR